MSKIIHNKEITRDASEKLNKLVSDEIRSRNMYAPYKKLAVNNFGLNLVKGLIERGVSEN